MNTHGDDEKRAALEQRSRELFNDSVDNLDAHTRSRLTQARHAALQAAHDRKHTTIMRWLVPIGSVAALALVAMVSLQFMRGEPSRSVQSGSGIEDMEIIASADQMELLQNDVEFYDWIESPEAAAPEGEAT